jgi:hypothetical protein
VALGHKSPPSSVEEKHPRPFANIFFLLCWGFAVWSEPFFWMLWALTVVTLTLPCLCPATCPIRYYPYRSLGFHTNSSAKLASNNPGPGAEMCKDAEMQRCFGKHATLPRCHAIHRHLFSGLNTRSLNGVYSMEMSSSIRSNCSAPILGQ